MSQVTGLILTLIVGLSIILGTIIVFKMKNSEKLISLSVSIAFGVMISLIIFDLLPEAFELIDYDFGIKKIFIIIGLSLIGIFILKLFDLFIPNHGHNHKHRHDEEEHLYHIGIVSSIALVLHNIIEGMALYSAAITSISLGWLLALGIGLHNLPLGMVITSAFYLTNKSVKKTFIISFLISISTFFGGLIMYFLNLNGNYINDYFLGVLICITLGMIFYIAIFELLPKIIEDKNKKLSVVGVIIGICIILIHYFL
ncbi:MAG: ZIP family metal transporter [Ignavibacteriales bacterium]